MYYYRILLILLLISGIIFLGCSTSSQSKPPVKIDERVNIQPEPRYADTAINEDFDPTTLNDNEIDINELMLDKKRQNGKKVPLKALSEDQKAINLNENINTNPDFDDSTLIFREKEMISGWRVQICAISNEKRAREIWKQAENIFEKYENYHVYFTYDSPYYKVRVGDFTSRYNADRLLQIATENNFPDAWVVKTNVYKQDDLHHPQNILNEVPEDDHSQQH